MKRNKKQEGVALILVLWVVVLLTAIVMEFAFSMRTEVNITRNFKEEQEAYYAALAGIEQAKAEIIASQDKMYLDENNALVLSDDKKNFERKGKFNNVVYSYEIIDEERKININSANPDHLRYLLSNSGVEGEELDIIIDSILDWRDPDNLNRLNGAEEDYYQSLPQPYSCKDAPFDTIEELLLVKGMKPEILYGSKKSKVEEQKYKGIADYLTAKSSNMINVNTADRLVLEAWFGSAMVENIIAQRKGGLVAVPVAGGAVKSTYFSILSTGRSGGVVRTIKTIVLKKNDKTIDVVYWNDNWRESVVKFVENKPQEQK